MVYLECLEVLSFTEKPWKINSLNLKSWWFGSDDFSDFNWVNFRFQPFIFRGVHGNLFLHVVPLMYSLLTWNTFWKIPHPTSKNCKEIAPDLRPNLYTKVFNFSPKCVWLQQRVSTSKKVSLTDTKKGVQTKNPPPGDSKWPCYPQFVGKKKTTFPRGHVNSLTIPKKGHKLEELPGPLQGSLYYQPKQCTI